MQSGVRIFNDMNFFQSSGTNRFDQTEHEKEDMEKIYEEIDQELNRRLFKGEMDHQLKKPGRPLIFEPPAIKSAKEKFSIEEGIEEESKDESSEAYVDKSFIDKAEEDFREVETATADDEENETSDSADYFKEQKKIESKVEKKNVTIGNNSALTKVMLPVLLSNVSVEVDVFENFKLSRMIHSVTNSEIFLHSLEAEVLLPSENLFVKGMLILDLDYTGEHGSGTMHSLKVEIPWRKIIPVKWMLPPDIPWKRSEEYTVITPHGQDEGTMREQIEHLTEKIDFKATSLHVVWNEQFVEKDRVLINGTASIALELYQKQLVELRRIIL